MFYCPLPRKPSKSCVETMGMCPFTVLSNQSVTSYKSSCHLFQQEKEPHMQAAEPAMRDTHTNTVLLRVEWIYPTYILYYTVKNMG